MNILLGFEHLGLIAFWLKGWFRRSYTLKAESDKIYIVIIKGYSAGSY